MMSGMTGAERAEVMVRMTFGPNHRIKFSPDGGSVIVTGSYDGTARTWEVTTGRPLVTFAGRGASRRTGTRAAPESAGSP